MGSINYSLSWEDSVFWNRVEPGQDIAIVSSGGCQVLSALLTNPKELLAVDVNENQLYLLELKLAAVSKLEYTEFIDFIGLTGYSRNSHRWDMYVEIRDQISAQASVFWDNQRTSIELGIVHSGKFEHYLQVFRRWLLPLVISKSKLNDCLNSASLKEQEIFYKEAVEGWIYNNLFKLYYGKSYMQRKGRQSELLQHVDVDVPEVFKERMKRAWYGIPIKENYFMRYVLCGFMDIDLPIPSWAREENFQILKNGMSKVKYEQADIAELPRVEQFDVIYLSNAFEAKTESDAQVGFDNLAAMLKPNGQLALWNNLVERIPHTAKLQFQKEASEQIWNHRMSAFFGYFGIFKKT